MTNPTRGRDVLWPRSAVARQNVKTDLDYVYYVIGIHLFSHALQIRLKSKKETKGCRLWKWPTIDDSDAHAQAFGRSRTLVVQGAGVGTLGSVLVQSCLPEN
jgi:hypothetical protein